MNTKQIDYILEPFNKLIDEVLEHVCLDEGAQCLIDTRDEIKKRLENPGGVV